MEGADPRTDGELLVATPHDPEAFATFPPASLPRRADVLPAARGIAWNKLHEAQGRGHGEDTDDAAA